MVKVKISGDDTRKGEDGTAHLRWSEAQAMVAAGAAEIVNEHDGAEPDRPTVEEADLGRMTRADLEAMAAERGVDVSGARTKDDVIAALRA